VKERELGSPLDVNEIREYKRKYVHDLKATGARLVTIPYYEEFYITYKGRLVRDQIHKENLSTWAELLAIIDPMIEDHLRNKGWQNGTDIAEDFNVYLEQGTRRIIVEDQDGNRLKADA
jgi:hypothetical protein